MNQTEEEKLNKIFNIFNIEKQKFNIWQCIKQAEENSKEESRIPMVVFRRNNAKTYCVVEFEKLINLLYPKREQTMVNVEYQEVQATDFSSQQIENITNNLKK